MSGGGNVMETRDYYPFGLMMPGRETKESVSAKEDYTGHELDAETGLHYAGAPQEYFLAGDRGSPGSGRPLLHEWPRTVDQPRPAGR